MNIKHSIVIICFNQESLIERALESVVRQTSLPSELLILDDCSIDATVKRAEHYLRLANPTFPYRIISNHKNLGIPGNITKASLNAAGNVITILSGDDVIEPYTLEITNTAIVNANLNPDVDCFVAFMPAREGMILGKISPYSIYKKSTFKTMLRKYAPFVKVGFSASALRSVEYPNNIGLWADWVWDVSICAKAKKYYQTVLPCYVHASGVGISSKTPEVELNFSYLQSAKYIFDNYKSYFDLSDTLYILGEIYYLEGKITKKIGWKLLGFILFLINLFQTKSMVAFKSSVSRYIPTKLLSAIRA
jgi:glycosyltransferase involved in cell wall biosynthesis